MYEFLSDLTMKLMFYWLMFSDSEFDDVQMGVVDCGEWTDLCAAQSRPTLPIPFQPFTAFPTVLLLCPKESALHYRGMLGSEALFRFIML